MRPHPIHVGLIALMAMLTGCARPAVRPTVPVPAATPTPAPSVAAPVAMMPREALNLATTAPTPPPETPATPVPAEAPATVAVALADAAPTPILDAALHRAEALHATVASEVARPESPSPPPAAAAPPAAPAITEQPTPQPRPSEPSPVAVEPIPPLEVLPEPAPTPQPELSTKPEPTAEVARPVEPSSTTPAVPPSNPPAASEESTPGATPEVVEAPLQITALKLCRRVRGFGQVDPWTAPQIRPGQSVIVYSELSGVHYEEAGHRFRSRIAATVEWLAEGAETPVRRETLGLAEDAADQPRREFFVGYVVTVPASLPLGSYHLRVTQVDEVGRGTDSRLVRLVVGP